MFGAVNIKINSNTNMAVMVKFFMLVLNNPLKWLSC